MDVDEVWHVAGAEPSWVREDNEKCGKRAHRYGQKSSVLAKFLVAEGSFSEVILGTAIDKYHTINQTLDQQE